MNKKEGWIPALDGIKGICAFCIAFFWHYRHFILESLPMYSIFKPFYDNGDALTDVFFVISGLVMTMGYESRIINREIGSNKFFLYRAKKIFPTFVFSTIIVAMLQFILLILTGNIFVYPIYSYDLYNLFLNFWGIQYGLVGEVFSFNGPAWYISVLLFCYLIFYISVSCFRNNNDVIAPIYFLIVQIGLAIYKSDQLGLEYIFVIGRGAAGFFTGSILARMIQRKERLNEKVVGYF